MATQPKNGGLRGRQSLTSSSQDIHRTPPHSVEAEQGVLGSMLISPRDTIAECVEKINEEYFYVPAHQTIYTVLVELWNAGQAIDLITFTQVLRDRNLLESLGGAAFVTSLFTFVPTAANVQYYLDIVRDKYILRSIIAAATESVRRAYEEQDEVGKLLDEVEQRIFAVGEDRFKGQMLSMKDQVMEAIESIEKLYERKGGITGISTGFVEFDRMTSGGPAEHGKDGAGHEHRRARRHQRKTFRRRLQLGNEQPAACPTSTLLTRTSEFTKSARRISG